MTSLVLKDLRRNHMHYNYACAYTDCYTNCVRYHLHESWVYIEHPGIISRMSSIVWIRTSFYFSIRSRISSIHHEPTQQTRCGGVGSSIIPRHTYVQHIPAFPLIASLPRHSSSRCVPATTDIMLHHISSLPHDEHPHSPHHEHPTLPHHASTSYMLVK